MVSRGWLKVDVDDYSDRSEIAPGIEIPHLLVYESQAKVRNEGMWSKSMSDALRTFFTP
jgi:hypothetical protein